MHQYFVQYISNLITNAKYNSRFTEPQNILLQIFVGWENQNILFHYPSHEQIKTQTTPVGINRIGQLCPQDWDHELHIPLQVWRSEDSVIVPVGQTQL